MEYDQDAGYAANHMDYGGSSGSGSGAAAALMNPQHGALMLMATSLLGGSSEMSERLRLLMTLVLLLPQLKPLIESAVRVVRRVWLLMTRSSDGKYIQSVRKLAAHTCEDGYGRCQSSEMPRRTRAVFDRIRDCFEHNDAWCATAGDAVAVDQQQRQQQVADLEEYVMDDLRIDECCAETLVLLKRGDACPAKIRVGHGTYVRSYKTVEQRGQTQSLTMTQLFVEVLVDVRVHPGAARYDAAERFLRDCEHALDAKESDELCGPHIFTMIRGDEKPDDDGCRSSDDGDSEDDDETSHARRRNRGRGGFRRRGLGFLVKAINKSNSVPDNPTFPEKDAIVGDVAAFLGNEDQYRRRGIPYNKSFLLRSYPGCGKSRFFTDLAAMFDLVLIHVNPDMVRTEESLRELWFADYIGGYSVPHKRRLYVIDDPCCTDWAHVIRRKPTTDASSTTKSTKKTKASSSLFSLGALLNALDGIVKREGHLMFVTTNKSIDFFEPALVRAGRFGSVVNVSRMSAHGIAALFSKWFDQQLPPDVLEVLRDDTLTVADVANDVFSSFDVPTICAQLKYRFAAAGGGGSGGSGGGVAAVCDKSTNTSSSTFAKNKSHRIR